MFRAQVCVLVGLGLMLAAASTEARELEFFVENRLGWDNNVFRRAENSAARTKADGFWELAPRVELHDSQDELAYDFRYQPSYQQFFKESGVSGFDHNARGRLDWRATPVDSLGLNSTFGSNRSLREDADGVDPDSPLQGNDRLRIKRTRSSAYYQHSFNQTFSARLDYAFDDLDYSQRDFSDSRAHTVSGGLNYSLNPLTSVGTTVTARFRNSKVNQFNPFIGALQEVRSETNTVDISFSLSRQLTKTLDVSVQAGPSISETQQDVQPPAFPSQARSNSSDVNVFAAVSARKRWRNGHLRLAYSRFESGGGGNVTSSIVDDVSIDAAFRPDRRWDLRVLASWNQRENIASGVSSFRGDTKTTVYRVTGTVGRRISSNLKLIGRMQYRTQKEKRLGSDPRTEIFSGWLALQYNFDPIVF